MAPTIPSETVVIPTSVPVIFESLLSNTLDYNREPILKTINGFLKKRDIKLNIYTEIFLRIIDDLDINEYNALYKELDLKKADQIRYIRDWFNACNILMINKQGNDKVLESVVKRQTERIKLSEKLFVECETRVYRKFK